MPYVLIAAYVLLIAPMQVGLLLQWKKGKLSMTVGLMAWGVRKRFPFLLHRNEQGKLQLHIPHFPIRRSRKKRKDLLSLLPRLIYVRKKIKSAIHVRHFQVEASLALPTAAGEAICATLLTSLLHMLFPHGRCHIRPAYKDTGGGTALCIVDFRLGTLLMAGILWKTHRLSDSKKEEQVWSIPSEN